MKRKARQIIAVIALAAFFIFTVFGTVGLVVSASHSCYGMHCRTCTHIAVVEQTVHILKAALLVLLAFLFVSETLALLASKLPPPVDYPTAITLKTKLNS